MLDSGAEHDRRLTLAEEGVDYCEVLSEREEDHGLGIDAVQYGRHDGCNALWTEMAERRRNYSATARDCLVQTTAPTVSR